MPQLGPPVDMHGPIGGMRVNPSARIPLRTWQGCSYRNHSLPGAGLRASASNTSSPSGKQLGLPCFQQLSVLGLDRSK
jgi:hypothetical protein